MFFSYHLHVFSIVFVFLDIGSDHNMKRSHKTKRKLDQISIAAHSGWYIELCVHMLMFLFINIMYILYVVGRPCTCLGSKKSWVQIPPEAAHISLKREGGLSQVLLCCVVCHLYCLTTFLISSTLMFYNCA